MYITRPLHIVSHPLYTENYMQVGDPESERLITMTSLPVANNVQYTTRPLHIVSHPLYTENYMQVGDPESERLITMTSLPVANNVQYTHHIHIVYTKTLPLSFIH